MSWYLAAITTNENIIHRPCVQTEREILRDTRRLRDQQQMEGGQTQNGTMGGEQGRMRRTESDAGKTVMGKDAEGHWKKGKKERETE